MKQWLSVVGDSRKVSTTAIRVMKVQEQLTSSALRLKKQVVCRDLAIE
jgi:hypothetical protein